ncbi:MAG: molecular chaperone TorD family protein [Burkholderiales bacterium]
MSEQPTSVPIAVHPRLTDEDRARAEFYAVLGRLFSGPPDGALLRLLADAALPEEDDAPPVIRAWNRLVDASRAMDPDAAAQEYTDLFIGVGKAECNLHASYWVRDAAVRPLVAVRADLAELGLVRASGSTVYEDHLGALCETMRLLVAGAPDARPPAAIDVQRRFFQRHLEPWVIACVDSIPACAVANYYARVAQFAAAYVALERDSFAIE